MSKMEKAVSPKDALQQEYYEWISKQERKLKIWMENCVAGKESINLSFKTNNGKTFTVLCPSNYPREAGHFLIEPNEDLQFWCQTVNEYLLDHQGVKASLTAVLDEILQFYESHLESVVTFPFKKNEDKAINVIEDKAPCGPGEASKSDHGDEQILSKGEKRLLEDLDEWSAKNNFYFILKKKFKSNDGSIHFDFATPSKDDFTLLCPPSYPSDDTFMAFADSDSQLWTQQLNEFLLSETSKRSSLPEALDEAKNLYITYHDAAGDTSAKRPRIDPDVTEMLKAELETIRRSDVKGISVKLINNDISRWLISLSKFSSNSSLSKDLAELNSKFHYDDIQLELLIDLNVHPFYPPTLKLVRPRLQKNSVISVLKIDVLKLSQWDPERKISSILLDAKHFFENHVRVDLNSEKNDHKLYSEGSYSDIENHLFRLASACEIQSRGDLEDNENQQSGPTNKSGVATTPSPSSKKKAKLTANGVGYSGDSDDFEDYEVLYFGGPHSSGTGFSGSFSKTAAFKSPDPLTYRLRDEQLAVILRDIIESLRERHSISSPETESVKENYYQLLESSCLIPFLESELRSVSVLEIDKHMPIYRCVTDVICEIAAHDDLVPLLWKLPRQSESIYALTETVLTKAETLLKQIEKGSKPTVSSRKNSESSIEEEFSLSVRTMSEIIAKALVAKKLLKLEETSGSGESLSEPPVANSAGLNETYIKELKKLQFAEHNMKKTGVVHHSFASDFKKSSNVNPKLIKRMSQDFGELSASLPISIESTIFVRVDDTNLTLLRALIIGPQGTPYSGGCFLFDIYCPSDYPSVPPKVKFLTTGGGKVRFNPNLYECGKVCLSLLGTWSGEQWRADSSTLLQVLVSIQSLIFVAEPYFNEPGFQHLMGTAQGKAQSKAYNDSVVIDTIQHAMVEQILHPSKDFEEVINKHFSLRKDEILQELETRLQSKFSKRLDDAIQKLRDVFQKI